MLGGVPSPLEYIITQPPPLGNTFFEKNKKRFPPVFPCGLTDSPTSCPWEGSAVGLEPTAHGRGKFFRVSLAGDGVEPSAPPRSAVNTSDVPARSARGGSTGCIGLSVAFGLSLCCDYSITQPSAYVNPFFEKTFLFFFQKPLDNTM